MDVYGKIKKNTLEFALKYLSCMPLYEKYWNKNNEGFIRGSDKIVTETLLMLYLLDRGDQLGDLIELKNKIIKCLEPEARSVRNASLIMRFPQLSLSLGISHIVLNKMGWFDSDFDYLLNNSISHPLSKSGEKLAFRAMDSEWVRYIYKESMAPIENAMKHYDSSILGETTHPIYMDRIDFYALTHCIMYLTDFGELRFPVKSDIEKISSMIDDAIKWQLHEKDLDLMSELILCSIYINGRLTETCSVGLDFILEIWERVGFIPSWSFNTVCFDDLKGEEKASYFFSNVYHTLFVGTLLVDELERKSIKRCRHVSSVDEDNKNIDFQNMINNYKKAFSTSESSTEWIDSLIRVDLPMSMKIEIITDVFIQAAIKKYDIDVAVNLLVYLMPKKSNSTQIMKVAYDYIKLQQLYDGSYGSHFLIEENRKADICDKFKTQVSMLLNAYEETL